MVNPKGSKVPDNQNDVYNYLGLGLQLAVTVAVMVFLGIWLDKQFNTSPFLTVGCSFLGVFAALYNFIKTVIKSEK
jgi:F0F1-type ATP synthase assembly protein I